MDDTSNNNANNNPSALLLGMIELDCREAWTDEITSILYDYPTPLL